MVKCKITLVYKSRVELDRHFASDDLSEETGGITRRGVAVLHVVFSLKESEMIYQLVGEIRRISEKRQGCGSGCASWIRYTSITREIVFEFLGVGS